MAIVPVIAGECPRGHGLAHQGGDHLPPRQSVLPDGSGCDVPLSGRVAKVLLALIACGLVVRAFGPVQTIGEELAAVLLVSEGFDRS
jgi:hypothetical protein